MIARLLSLQDRNPLSSTYGCLDRNFWHFKTIIDFPSATYQQAILGLAELNHHSDKHNNLQNTPIIKESIKSGLLYWCRIQNNDGSFNEYYQNDCSFCPAAFTTYAIAKTFYLSRDIFSDLEQSLIEKALLKSGSWLARHSFPEVQNQMIASMNALYYSAEVLDSDVLKIGFNKRREEVLNSQNNEGWFPEYDGADIGYSFIALDLFASYLEEKEDGDIIEVASKMIRFIIRFLHPDGTAGGAYGSRCTSHVMPYGVEYFSDKGIPEAIYLYDWYNYQKKENRIIDPSQIDDKYFTYFYFNSYAQAYLSKDKSKMDINCNDSIKFESVEKFDNAGLLRYEKGRMQVFISWKRKGVIYIYLDDKLVYSDTGYIFRLSNGTKGITQNMDEDAIIQFQEKGDIFQITIRGNSGRMDDSLPLVKWMIPFKIFCKTILKINSIGYWFNRWLKKNRVGKQYPIPVSICREMHFSSKEIVFKDKLIIDVKGITFSKIKLTRNVTSVHSPSSRFLQQQHLIHDLSEGESEQSERSALFTYKISLQSDSPI